MLDHGGGLAPRSATLRSDLSFQGLRPCDGSRVGNREELQVAAAWSLEKRLGMWLPPKVGLNKQQINVLRNSPRFHFCGPEGSFYFFQGNTPRYEFDLGEHSPVRIDLAVEHSPVRICPWGTLPGTFFSHTPVSAGVLGEHSPVRSEMCLFSVMDSRLLHYFFVKIRVRILARKIHVFFWKNTVRSGCTLLGPLLSCSSADQVF